MRNCGHSKVKLIGLMKTTVGSPEHLTFPSDTPLPPLPLPWCLQVHRPAMSSAPSLLQVVSCVSEILQKLS